MPLFTGLVAFMAPDVGNDDRVLWCTFWLLYRIAYAPGRYGGVLASSPHQSAVRYVFSNQSHGSVYIRLIAVFVVIRSDRIVFAPKWIHACIEARTVVPTWPYIVASPIRHRSVLKATNLSDVMDFDQSGLNVVRRHQS
jgi:hypothetical protein